MPLLPRGLAHGVRSLRNNPGFTVTALVTLALGIGASTAIFSVVNAVLLRPLPYPDADRLVVITSDMVARNVKDFPLPAGDVAEMRDGGTDFTGIAAVTSFTTSMLNSDGQAETIRGVAASTNLFSVLGVHVIAGRDFTEADGTPPPRNTGPGAAAPTTPPPPPTVILGYGYWQSHYAGDRSVVGRMIDVAPGRRAQVVGVAPQGLVLLLPPAFKIIESPDMYVAARIDWAAGSHINVAWRSVARLKPGVTLAAARGQMNTIADHLAVETPIKKTAGYRVRVEPMRQELVADVRSAVLALMGGVTFVLLIACANVANLLLVRTSRRERELAVRAALGGSRARLVRQMLAEALLLSAASAVLGIGLAELGVKVLVAIGPQNLPTVGGVSIDPTVLVFTVLAGAAAAVIFGVLPALRASRPDIVGVLRSSGRTSELGAGRTLRNAVVTIEVALAFVLLVGSGLMLRSFAAMTRAKPGFQPDGLLTFDAQNRQARTPKEEEAFLSTMQQRLAALPGVTGVTATLDLPFSGLDALCRWGPESAINDPEAFQQAFFYAVMPGYFKVMQTKVLAGRTFTEDDNTVTSPSVVIDRVLAAKAFPGKPAAFAVGKHLYARYRSDTPELLNVIGVVDQERTESPAVDGREQLFFVNGQFNHRAAGTWVVRTSGDPAAPGPEIRSLAKEIAPSMPVMNMKPMTDYLADARAPTRFALVLIGTFAGIALVLAAVGLYGVLSTVVRQRTAEIGVRMAFGAPKERIFRQMVGEGLRLGAVGLLLGVLAALLLTGAMRSMLVGVAPTDSATFVAIAAVFLGIAALSCWLPARRAAALDPAEALREE
jgi:putative ABC transport system permease protein